MLSLRLPAGTLASLKVAVDNGADAVYTGIASASNARNFPGLNLTAEELAEGVEYAHSRSCDVYVTSNVYPQREIETSLSAVDIAAEAGADAIIAADISVLDHAQRHHPSMARHLSSIAAASNARAINFFRDRFGISCAVLPRVTSLDDIAGIRAATDVELEVFAFGVL